MLWKRQGGLVVVKFVGDVFGQLLSARSAVSRVVCGDGQNSERERFCDGWSWDCSTALSMVIRPSVWVAASRGAGWGGRETKRRKTRGAGKDKLHPRASVITTRLGRLHPPLLDNLCDRREQKHGAD